MGTDVKLGSHTSVASQAASYEYRPQNTRASALPLTRVGEDLQIVALDELSYQIELNYFE